MPGTSEFGISKLIRVIGNVTWLIYFKSGIVKAQNIGMAVFIMTGKVKFKSAL